jgi:hypothetical protein
MAAQAQLALGSALITAVLMLPTSASAQWLWRGADGRVTASDRPPPNTVADKDIIKRPGADPKRKAPGAPEAGASGPATGAVGQAATPAKAAASAPESALDKEIEAKKRAAEQEKVAKAKAEEDKAAAVREVNCRSARSHASTLESGVRIARNNDKGEREFVDERTRADELRRARETIASDCR